MNAPVTTNNSFQSAGQGKTPFVATHRRRDRGHPETFSFWSE